ncbi:hypothetical protein [Nocardia sp. NPDC051570]|uniref:hypothetical protein n=1 Tax=Nocardia sp. NPDC051570 TaxID=3364324 RepID=UPI0037A982A2
MGDSISQQVLLREYDNIAALLRDRGEDAAAGRVEILRRAYEQSLRDSEEIREVISGQSHS